MCLGNSVFNGVLGVNITATKFAPEVVKFCCNCVYVENRVSEVKGYQLKRLLQNEGRDAKFNPMIVMPRCGEVKECSVRCSEWMWVRSTASICALVTK